MRSLLVGLLLTAALPASAQAAFAPPVSLPATAGEVPVALATTGTGGMLVTASGGPPYSAGTQAIIQIASGARRTFADTIVLDQVPGPGASVDLLVRRGAGPT